MTDTPALDIRDGMVLAARIALGGVAHKPWRATASEDILVNRRLEAQTLGSAASFAVQGAHPYPHNAFKVELAQRAVVRALQLAAQMEGTGT